MANALEQAYNKQVNLQETLDAERLNHQLSHLDLTTRYADSMALSAEKELANNLLHKLNYLNLAVTQSQTMADVIEQRDAANMQRTQLNNQSLFAKNQNAGNQNSLFQQGNEKPESPAGTIPNSDTTLDLTS